MNFERMTLSCIIPIVLDTEGYKWDYYKYNQARIQEK